jgi:hypothetical protein
MKDPRFRPRPIGDLVRRALDDLGVSPAADLELLRDAWPRIAGGALIGRTSVVSYRGQVLTVRASNGPLRYEIDSFHKERLLDALRRELPSIVVSQLRIVS